MSPRTMLEPDQWDSVRTASSAASPARSFAAPSASQQPTASTCWRLALILSFGSGWQNVSVPPCAGLDGLGHERCEYLLRMGTLRGLAVIGAFPTSRRNLVRRLTVKLTA